MASPSIATTATTNGEAATTSPVVNLPASIAAGDTLIIAIRVTGVGGVSWPGGWTELFDDSTDGASDRSAAAWRKADGTEGATVTLTNGSNGKFAALAWRITGATDPTVTAPEFATLVTGSGTTPDPGSVSPTGGSNDYLFLAVAYQAGESTSPPGTFPTNYSLNQIGANSGTGGAASSNVTIAGAGRQLTAASDDPGTFTFSTSEPWTATTIAIHPSGGGGGPTVKPWYFYAQQR